MNDFFWGGIQGQLTPRRCFSCVDFFGDYFVRGGTFLVEWKVGEVGRLSFWVQTATVSPLSSLDLWWSSRRGTG